jgi:hypothetical protein
MAHHPVLQRSTSKLRECCPECRPQAECVKPRVNLDLNAVRVLPGQSISGFGGLGCGFVAGLNGVDGRRCFNGRRLAAFLAAAFLAAAFFLVAIHLPFFGGIGGFRSGGNGSDGLIVFGGSASPVRPGGCRFLTGDGVFLSFRNSSRDNRPGKLSEPSPLLDRSTSDPAPVRPALRLACNLRGPFWPDRHVRAISPRPVGFP